MFHDPHRLEQPLPLTGQQALARARQVQEAQLPQQGAGIAGAVREQAMSDATGENTQRAEFQGLQLHQSSAMPLDRGQQMAQAAKAHLQAYTEQQQGVPLAGKAGLRKMLAQQGADPSTVNPAQLGQMIGLA